MGFSLARLLTPATRAVPTLPWSATSPLSFRPRTLIVLVLGLIACGCGEGLLLAAGLGPTPWTVLAQGLTHQLGWTIGWTTLLCSLLVFGCWIPLRQIPGVGSIANMLIIPLFLQLVSSAVSRPLSFGPQLLLAVAGVVTFGLGGALYITCALGPGPRDGLMTGLQRRTGYHLAYVRLTIEVVVLVTGLALGGQAGLGTLLFALFIGHVLTWWLGLVTRVAARTGA